MYMLHDAPLSGYSTMRLGGKAKHLTEVNSRQEVAQAVEWANGQNLPAIMMGEGSNIVWSDKGWPGLVLVNKIAGFETYDEDGTNLYVTVGGGEHWDGVVERTVSQGLHGIEALSLIPGTAGATPVQNVGAYGQEIAETLVSVEAFDNQTKSFITIPNADCAFAYRTSRFKTTEKGRFFITGLTLHLMKTNPEPPFYQSVQAYFDQAKINSYTPKTLRDAVIAIRTAKLPDPNIVANNGSFFHNPIVDNETFSQLEANYSDIVHWDTSQGRIKISAAWLIEKAGFKDMHDQETGMATWPKQALVLINEHAKNTGDLIRFKQKIIDKVQEMFGITLSQEPELIGEQ